MTIAAFLGSALPWVFAVLVAVGVWLYFNKFQPWFNHVLKPIIVKWLNRRRSLHKRWDIHAR